jgi:hypothetical protein
MNVSETMKANRSKDKEAEKAKLEAMANVDA